VTQQFRLGTEIGGNGAAGSITLDDGTVLQPKGWRHVPKLLAILPSAIRKSEHRIMRAAS
jgi:hypothetical protein